MDNQYPKPPSQPAPGIWASLWNAIKTPGAYPQSNAPEKYITIDPSKALKNVQDLHPEDKY